MTTHDLIPPSSPSPRESSLREPSTLDRKRSSPRVAPMKPDDERDAAKRALLRQQPWGRLLGQLTAIALKRIHGRSTADAQDLAQSAIADAYESVGRGGWDPDRGQLVSYLVARVITRAAAERRRKRTTCEVWLDEELEDDGEETEETRYEKHLADDKPGADVALHRLRFASTFHDRLVARLAGDALALEAIPFMKEGLFTQVDLAVATGRSEAEMKDALRRIRYHSKELVKELSAQAATPPADPRSKEVMQ
jgi:DNA-directed RNA polymerase specialized sigma24 family protein